MATNIQASVVGSIVEQLKDIVESTVGNVGQRVTVTDRLAPTANNTEIKMLFVCPSGYTFTYDEIQFASGEVPADSDGTVLIDVIERDASADTETTVVNDQDAEALVQYEGVDATLNSVTLPRTIDEHDSIRFVVVNNSAALDTAGEVICRVSGTLRRKS